MDLKEMMKQNINKLKGDHPSYDDLIAHLVQTPFTRWIGETNPPSRFVAPKFANLMEPPFKRSK